jgi:hypothetical protein
MDYQEFPLVLNHPAHRPARRIADATRGSGNGLEEGSHGFGTPEQWEPERFPQVTVTTPDQEQEYLAKGYVRAGQANAAAFSTAHASPYVAGRTTSEYPKMVNGVLVQDPNAPARGPIEFPKWLTPPEGEAVLVHNVAEEEALRAQWEPAKPQTLKLKKKRGRPAKAKVAHVEALAIESVPTE